MATPTAGPWLTGYVASRYRDDHIPLRQLAAEVGRRSSTVAAWLRAAGVPVAAGGRR